MKSIILTIMVFVSVLSTAQEKEKLDSIPKKEKTNELQEVAVYGNRKQFIKVDSDKTTVNIKDNPMLSTGNAYEAVKKLPGIISSPTGSLSLNGKGVTIFIDGAPSTLSGTDLENYLSSLPANAIEKVELIYNPGAAFDANASGSVINIITSSKRLKGINASANINYNFNKYQKPSPQILLNGKENSFSWQTMLGYNYIDSEEKSINNQTFTSFNPQKSLNQENFNTDTNRNLYFRVGTNFKLSKISNLLFNYNLNAENDRSIYNSKIGGDISNYFTSGISKTKSTNNEISLQYKTKLDTLGKTLDVVAFTNIFERNPKNISSGTGNTFNNSNIDFALLNTYLKYDFAIPFKKLDLSLSTGGKYNTLKVDNNGLYISDISPNNFTKFDYSENNLAFYAELRKKIKKFNFTAGLRFEDFRVNRNATQIENSVTQTSNIKYNNTNFFPNISALYELVEKVNVSASYSKKIEQPNYNSIDPNNRTNVNQYNASTGNIELKPTYFDNYEFKISALDFVQLGANYTVGKDDTRFIFNANPNELVSNQTTQAFDKIKTFSAFFSFPVPLDYFFKGKVEFQKRMNTIDKMNYIFLNINYVKSNIEGFVLPYGNKAITNYSAQSQFILPWNITNTMTYFILPKGTWEIYGIEKPIQQFDISFNRDFMNKKLKVGLHAFDVFNANEINALISGDNLDTRFFQKRDSRNFRISLTYNFGNLKLEKENTKIDVEKVKSGGGMMK
ncbi:outer membrane beta-barrel family protein [Flavobacterium sp.]|uniref:outer membrane beta-barrel family protein n=1 Tax=Flavobacterium sp. TaxID=239 RepID=UPI00286A4F1B|nr:outer membrane beta-barrel family protein [Flavobacterium sp.]